MDVQLHSLSDAANETYTLVGSTTTDATGRIKAWENLPAPHTYRLTFGTAAYFQRHGEQTFYPHVRILFAVQADQHYHVPLLVSPFGYSTYRGN
jgi:5-hydroxyisourate hydrolase